MALITVDSEKCVNDGLCRDACSEYLIEIDNEGLPRPVFDIENHCIKCGHCVAICPTEALSHSDLPQNEFVEIREELAVDQDTMEQLIKSRRSNRNYLDKPVPRAVIEKVLDFVRFAPTGKNTQNVTYSVFDNHQVLENIADCVIDFFRIMVKTKQDQQLPFDLSRVIQAHENGIDVILRNAPVLITTFEEINPMTGISSHIALTTLEFAAIGLGLGTCWAGYVMMPSMGGYEPLLELLKIPKNQQLGGAMMLGYPQLKYRKIPVRNEPNIIWND